MALFNLDTLSPNISCFDLGFYYLSMRELLPVVTYPCFESLLKLFEKSKLKGDGGQFKSTGSILSLNKTILLLKKINIIFCMFK